MQTFTELVNIVTEQTGDDSATTVRNVKRNINIANGKMLAAMGRHFTRASKKTNIVANQQYYQLPEDCIRVTSVWIEENNNKHDLTEIASEDEWNRISSNLVSTATYPDTYFVRGNDEVGIYPSPGSAITNGLVISYEANQTAMAVDDYTTGTVTATNGSATITGAGTTFSQSMVGRYLKVNNDGQWYKISAYVSSTAITLENYYDGIATGAGLAFTIGQAPNLPPQFHDSLADFALMRHYQRLKDKAIYRDFKALWDEAILTARQQYGVKTSSAVVNARPRRSYPDLFTRRPDAVS